jgi:choline monooxygenase
MDQEVDSDVEIVESKWLGSSSDVLKNNGVDSSLSYVCRREYTIECNWKVQSILVSFEISTLLDHRFETSIRIFSVIIFSQVFCDNYLDGGYHVPYAHKDLASGLKLDGYSTTVCFTFIL